MGGNGSILNLKGDKFELYGQSVLNPTEIEPQVKGNASQTNFHPQVDENGGASKGIMSNNLSSLHSHYNITSNNGASKGIMKRV